MSASFGTKLDTAELDRIAKQLGVKADRVGMRFAFQLSGIYTMNAKKVTGAMAASSYVEGKSQSDFSQKAAEARSANPDVVLERHPQPTGHIIANAGPSVEYAMYKEFGTSKMAADPVLGPAVESLSSKFNSGQEWKEIVA